MHKTETIVSTEATKKKSIQPYRYNNISCAYKPNVLCMVYVIGKCSYSIHGKRHVTGSIQILIWPQFLFFFFQELKSMSQCNK